MKRILLLMIMSIFILGCAQEPAPIVQPSGNVVELNMEVYNWGFEQEPVSIKAGDTVRITVKNTGGRHGVSFPQFGIQTGTILEGEEKTVEFVATKAGEYDYFCNVPCGKGHSGMKGTFEVIS